MNSAAQVHTQNPSPAQLTALHSLFRLYAPRFLGTARIERKERIAWAADRVGRPLASFSELHADEAARLIDLMKGVLGQKITAPSRSAAHSKWQRPDRDQAQAYGTAGRRSSRSNERTIVDAPTLALVDRLRAKLGWNQARLDAFLHSKNSPVSGGVIRTLQDANGVIWAMRQMLRRAETRSCTTVLVPDQSSLSFGTCPKEG
ncbi:MAG: hypothetical protein ACJ71W_16580 [Terriglobales bacterium]